MKRTLVFCVFVFVGLSVFCQNKVEVGFDVDLLSRHFWRGEQLGDAPAIEPNITLSKSDFSFSVWAAQTFNNSYSEIDIIPAYSFGNFTATVYDYYNPIPGANNNYFNFSGSENRHSGEVTVDYSGKGKIPLKIMVGTFFYGDKNPKTNQPFFSTYIELVYPFEIKTVEAQLYTGFTPAKGYYAQGFAFVQTGLILKKDLKLSKYLKMPFKVSGLYNPYTSKAFFIFGVGLSKI